VDPDRGCAEELLGLAETKRDCLNEALRLTQEMLLVLDSETPEHVEFLLDERQVCFDHLDECNRQYDLIYLSVREDLSPEGFALVRALDETCVEIGRSIQSVDREVSEKMHNVLEQLRQKISEVNTGKKGLAAYSQHQQAGEGMLIDEKK